MRELIDRGHLYIAQPPLYKVTRGKSEQYLKDERALEDLLIATGLDDCVFKADEETGSERAGLDLLSLMNAGIIRGILHNLRGPGCGHGCRAGGDRRRADPEDHRRHQRRCRRRHRQAPRQAGRRSRARLDRSLQRRRGFLLRAHRGCSIKDVAIIDDALLGSADARKLNDTGSSRKRIRIRAYCGARMPRPRSTARSACSEAVTDAGREGVVLQRYKGLGEMNAEQLWVTTLDTNARSLLQVKIKEVDEADDISCPS